MSLISYKKPDWCKGIGITFLGIYSGIIFISFLLVVFLVEDFAVKQIDANFRKKS